MTGLFGKTSKQPAPSPVAPPTPMPDPEDPAKDIEAQRRIAQRISRSGRQSTLLSQGQKDKLGG